MKITITIISIFLATLLMAQPSTFELELNKDGIVLPRINKGDKSSLTPVEGQLFYNPESSSLMLYNGTYWVSLSGTEMITDIDGNSYRIVDIDGMKWMADNLRTTKLNDGTPIAIGGPIGSVMEKGDINVKNISSTPMLWYYDNDAIQYAPTYGALYNHCAVASGNLCPTGFHIPTEADWNTLINSLGGSSVAGGSLKQAGFSNWKTPNVGATNTSGFTALPGGASFDGGTIFASIEEIGYYWSADVLPNNSSFAYYRSFSYTDAAASFEAFSVSTDAISVKCVQ